MKIKMPGLANNFRKNILQANLQKNKLATTELNEWKFDVALVQEPNLGPKGIPNLIRTPKKF